MSELVAGVLEADESPEITIRREILEEIGYEVSDLVYISSFYVSPGGSTERIIIYYAEVDNEGKVSKGGGLESEPVRSRRSWSSWWSPGAANWPA